MSIFNQRTARAQMKYCRTLQIVDALRESSKGKKVLFLVPDTKTKKEVEEILQRLVGKNVPENFSLKTSKEIDK